MAASTGDGLIYVALGLAAAVATMSVGYQSADTQQKLLWLPGTIGAGQPAGMAGQVGDDAGSPAFPVSP